MLNLYIACKGCVPFFPGFLSIMFFAHATHFPRYYFYIYDNNNESSTCVGCDSKRYKRDLFKDRGYHLVSVSCVRLIE